MEFSIDLAVEPLSNESIEYFKSAEGSRRHTGKKALEKIERYSNLLGVKTSQEPIIPGPQISTRRVLVIHHDGRSRPTMYGVKHMPYETTMSEFAKSLETYTSLDQGDCFIFGWCSLTYPHAIHGGKLTEDELVPIDDAQDFVLTAWRVPISPTYFMYEVSLGHGIGSMSPPLFLAAHDSEGLRRALSPFIDNEDLLQTMFVDSVAYVSPNPVRGTEWKRVIILLDEHVHANGVRVYMNTKTHVTHLSASNRTLLDEWKREGGAACARKVKDESTAAWVRESLYRPCHQPHHFTLRCIDETTIRVTIQVQTRYATLVPVRDHENRKRWYTALYIARKLRDSTGYTELLPLLEMDDDAPCVNQPLGIRIPLKTHQLQNIHRMIHLERETTFASISMARCSDTVWWDPRTDGIYPDEPANARSGGFLCDTVGLGKTLSMIALCLSNPPQQTENVFDTLVICPPSVLVQWRREIEKHTNLRVFEYHGKRKRDVENDMLRAYDIVLTTYATYTQSPQLAEITTWHRVIYDESHTMSDRITRFGPRARHTWCVTATPFHNIDRQLRALSSTLRFTMHGIPSLYYILEPLMIRHTQRQSHQLPALTVHDVAIQFQTNEEKWLYDQVFAQTVQQTRDRRHLDALEIHSHIHRLRRLCTCGSWSLGSLTTVQPSMSSTPDYALVAPHEEDDMCPICMNIYEQPAVTTCDHWFCADCIATALNIPPGKCPMCRNPQQLNDLRLGVLFGQTPEDTPMEDMEPNTSDLIECSSKLNRLLLMIKAMQSTDKAIIFCDSSLVIPTIMEALKSGGIKARCIHGSMPAIQRGNAIKAFQEDERTTVFVSSLRSAAAGINLTEANNIFFLGPVLNKANYTQAIGRAHRTGQMREVNVYNLYMEDTIEEKLIQSHEEWSLAKLYALFDE